MPYNVPYAMSYSLHRVLHVLYFVLQPCPACHVLTTKPVFKWHPCPTEVLDAILGGTPPSWMALTFSNMASTWDLGTTPILKKASLPSVFNFRQSTTVDAMFSGEGPEQRIPSHCGTEGKYKYRSPETPSYLAYKLAKTLRLDIITRIARIADCYYPKYYIK